ncbi:MAG: PIG-L family deacetylase [Victivallales bacterium]
MGNRILVIASHPDDEVLGCGGTVRRLANEGHNVRIAILGEGITSRCTQREQADQAELRQLQLRSQNACKLLGAENISFHSLPDNRFDTVPLLEVAKIIEGLIEDFHPSIVYTQHGGDLNIDHVITFRATLTAARPTENCPVKELYAYEVASSSEWSFSQFSPAFIPNFFVDINQTLDIKIKAMNIYEGEVRAFPHPRSAEALHATAQRWGSVIGVKAAEAFQLVRKSY